MKTYFNIKITANFSKKLFIFFLLGKLPQEVKKKEVFMKNFRGASNTCKA
jgi:hypothetical protein